MPVSLHVLDRKSLALWLRPEVSLGGTGTAAECAAVWWVADSEGEHPQLSSGGAVSFLGSGPPRQVPQCSVYILSVNPARHHLLLEEAGAGLLC